MKFSFEWKANTFDDAQKNKFEAEIAHKVKKHLKQVVSEEVEKLHCTLSEGTDKRCLLAGECCCIGQERKMIKIKVDSGFLIHCENNSWFQPRTNSD